jgi:hypothetical protein
MISPVWVSRIPTGNDRAEAPTISVYSAATPRRLPTSMVNAVLRTAAK